MSHARGVLSSHVFESVYRVEVIKIPRLIRAAFAHGEFEVTLISLCVDFYRPIGRGGGRSRGDVRGGEFGVFLRRKTGSRSGRIRVSSQSYGDARCSKKRSLA